MLTWLQNALVKYGVVCKLLTMLLVGAQDQVVIDVLYSDVAEVFNFDSTFLLSSTCRFIVFIHVVLQCFTFGKVL